MARNFKTHCNHNFRFSNFYAISIFCNAKVKCSAIFFFISRLYLGTTCFKFLWRCIESFRNSSPFHLIITQPVRTLFLFKSLWTRPQGSQGCQKIHKNMLQIKVLSFCARNTPKRHKLRKIVKIEKKCQKNLVFLEYFEYSSIWRQY